MMMMRLPTAGCGVVLALVLSVSLGAAGPSAPSRTTASQESAGRVAPANQVILVVGAPGTPEYKAVFTESLLLWIQACQKGGADVCVIGADPEDENAPDPNDAAADGDWQRLRQTLAAADPEAPAPLWLVLLGHGTFDGRQAKFNLRGRDLTAEQLSAWLSPLRRPLVVVNAASSSSPFLTKLSAPDRVIVTATKSGYEQNYARFHRYLAAAVGEPRADLDKDGQTSLLEAYLYAAHGVSEFYAAAGRLATEHALLDDNGDGLGTRADWFRGIRPVTKARDGAALDGYRAHQFHLVAGPFDRRLSPERRQRRDQLELEIIRLRNGLTGSPDAAYFARLEGLLLEIARIYEDTDGAGERPEAAGP